MVCWTIDGCRVPCQHLLLCVNSCQLKARTSSSRCQHLQQHQQQQASRCDQAILLLLQLQLSSSRSAVPLQVTMRTET
jgi:hypothetical protein